MNEEILTLQETISDLHKDLYGTRPRRYPDNIETLRNELEFLVDELRVAIETEKERAKQAKLDLNRRLNHLVDCHGISWQDAIRWSIEGDGAHDLESWLWQNGIAYSDWEYYR